MGPSKSENNIDAILKRGSHKSTSAIDTIIPLVSSMKVKNQNYGVGSGGGGAPPRVDNLSKDQQQDRSLLIDHCRKFKEETKNEEEEENVNKEEEPFESSTLLRKKKSSTTSISATGDRSQVELERDSSKTAKLSMENCDLPKNSSRTGTSSTASTSTSTEDCCRTAAQSLNFSKLTTSKGCCCSKSIASSRSPKSGKIYGIEQSHNISSSNTRQPASATGSQHIRRPRSKTEIYVKFDSAISPTIQRSKSRSFNDSYTSTDSQSSAKHMHNDMNVGHHHYGFEKDSLEKIADNDLNDVPFKVNGRRLRRKLPIPPTSQMDQLSPMNTPKQKKGGHHHKNKGLPKNRLFRTFSLPSSPFSTRKNDENHHNDALKRNARSLRDRLRNSIHGRERAVSLPEHELFPEDRELRCYKGAVRRGRREAVISLEFNQSVSLLVKTDDRFLEFTFVPPYQLEYT